MRYAWLIWSLILLGIWAAVYFSLRDRVSRREMLTVSAWTSLLGLTEPIFVPEYWSPLSLFNLAFRTGFDIESVLFAFGVGGLAVVAYEYIFPVRHARISTKERRQPRHRHHMLALFSAPIIFLALFIFTGINPIYSTIVALVGGGVATWYCRPDLKKKMFVSALIFFCLYFIYFLTLVAVFPRYVGEVWSIGAISGILIFGIPIEELLFALSLGFLWSSIYEHITWHKVIDTAR